MWKVSGAASQMDERTDGCLPAQRERATGQKRSMLPTGSCNLNNAVARRWSPEDRGQDLWAHEQVGKGSNRNWCLTERHFFLRNVRVLFNWIVCGRGFQGRVFFPKDLDGDAASKWAHSWLAVALVAEPLETVDLVDSAAHYARKQACMHAQALYGGVFLLASSGCGRTQLCVGWQRLKAPLWLANSQVHASNA